MKKITPVILIITILAGLFSACSKSGTGDYSTAGNPIVTFPSEQAPSQPTKANSIEPYQQGTFTSTLYYSEWLNLYLEIPSNMAAVNPETIKRYNDAGSGDEIVEMVVYQRNQAQSPQVQISVARKASGQSLSQFCDDTKRSVEDATKNLGNGIDVRVSWKKPTTYSFLGEKYLLYEEISKTYVNSVLTREGTMWLLFREKDDHFITINCSAFDCNVALAEILALFTTYDSVKYPSNSNSQNSSGTTISSGNKGNASDGDNTSNISSEPMEEGITPTHGKNLKEILDVSKVWKMSFNRPEYIGTFSYTFSTDGTCYLLLSHGFEPWLGGKGTYEINENSISFSIVLDNCCFTYSYDFDPQTYMLTQTSGKAIFSDFTSGTKHLLEQDDSNTVDKIKNMAQSLMGGL